MKPERNEFLSLLHPPARLTIEEAAWFLGFLPHEIPILIGTRLLRPLGNPAPNAQKFFLTATLEDLKRDEKWFSKASDAIMDHWRFKNNRKNPSPLVGSQQSNPLSKASLKQKLVDGKV